jgi:ubiquinone/menaquinone biosynthesis C-methylase UbiE
MRELLNRILGFIFFFSKKPKHFLWKKIYDRLAKTYDVFDWAFMNYGFDYNDKNQEPPLNQGDEKYRYCIQLYHHAVKGLQVEGKTVLEVGSGRGGGASYIARYMSPNKITGVDYSKNAVTLCNRIHNENNLEFVEGDASSLPFNNNSYDVIINVESSHCYPSLPRFLSEVKRVLKPGGLFAWTDLCPEKAIEKYEGAFSDFGMKCVESYEITKNVLGALDKETINEAKNEFIQKGTPFYLRGIMRDFSGVKNTNVYKTLKDGRTKYYFKVFQKI